jgi:predicted nucleic acid-binding protein
LHSGKQLTACASFPVLGELVNEVVTEPRKMKFLDVMAGLERSVRRGQLVSYGLGTTKTRAFETASDLRRRDYKLEVTDSLIVACAFEDGDCQVLYTLDAGILGSSEILSEARRRRKKVLPLA